MFLFDTLKNDSTSLSLIAHSHVYFNTFLYYLSRLAFSFLSLPFTLHPFPFNTCFNSLFLSSSARLQKKQQAVALECEPTSTTEVSLF